MCLVQVIIPFILSLCFQIITFDTHGVSGHPNHISVCEGTLLFKANAQTSPKELGLAATTPRVWALESVRLTRKYTTFFSAIGTRAVLAVAGIIQRILEATPIDVPKPADVRLTIISTPTQYVTTLAAMRKHVSQFVWFRWLYVSFSRYMWVNDIVEVRVT